MKRSLFSVPLFLSLCTAWSQPAPSRNQELLPHDEVVVTATRTGTDPFLAPAFVEVNTQADIEENLIRTVPEALKRMPGVAVQKTANGQGSPIVRGFTGYRTLALVDGIRYNHSAYRDGPNEYFSLIDPQALERLELVQGPGSVLYGSDAVGGALNLFTRGSDFAAQPEGKVFSHGSTFGRWHSSEQSWLGRADYNLGVGGEWGLHLGGTWKDFGDVIAAELGEQLFTGYTQRSYDAKFDARLDDHWTLTLAHQALWQDDAWRTHATIYGVSFAGSEVGSDLRRVTDYRRSLSYVRLRGEELEGMVSSAELTISYQSLDEYLERLRSNGVAELSSMNIGTLGFDAQFTSNVLGGTLTWGADYYQDRVETARRDLNADGTLKEVKVQGPVGDDASYHLLGVYAQQEVALGNHGTTLFLGGRYTFAKAEVGRYEDPVTGAAASLSDEWQNVVGSLRLVQDLNEKGSWKAFGGVSQAFRSPNLGDLSRLGASRSDEIESAATSLEPERFTSYELGVKHRGDRVRLSASAYWTVLEDYITSTPTGRVIDGQRQVTKQNSAKGFVRGAMTEMEWDITPAWTVFGGLTWTEGEADAYLGESVRREPLSRIPPLMAFYGVRWTSAEGKLWAELSGTSAARADRLNTADRGDTQRIPPNGTPGYTLLQIRAGWQVLTNVTLMAGLDNLLDEPYRVHGSGSNEPGFGGTLGVKVTF